MGEFHAINYSAVELTFCRCVCIVWNLFMIRAPYICQYNVQVEFFIQLLESACTSERQPGTLYNLVISIFVVAALLVIIATHHNLWVRAERRVIFSVLALFGSLYVVWWRAAHLQLLLVCNVAPAPIGLNFERNMLMVLIPKLWSMLVIVVRCSLGSLMSVMTVKFVVDLKLVERSTFISAEVFESWLLLVSIWRF